MTSITTNEKQQQICGEKVAEFTTTVTTNKEQQQQTLGTKVADTDTDLEKDDHTEKQLALGIASSENQDKIITSGSSIPSDLQSDSPETVDQNCSGVQNSQALIYNDKQIEPNNALESESDLSKDNQNSAILNEKLDSDNPHCNINYDVTSKRAVHDEMDELSLYCNVKNAEHQSSKDEEMLKHEKHPENDEDSSQNQEKDEVNTSNSSFNQEQEHLEMIGLEDGLEEGDLDFHVSIHGYNSNSKYSNDDYDVDSDEEYENQATMEYLKDVSVQKSNERSVSNENIDASDRLSNTLEKDSQSSTTKSEQISAIFEDEHLQNSQKSPSKIANDDAANSNGNSLIDEEDEDIIIDYENINNDFNHLKDVKPDVSTINNDLHVQVSETSDLQVPNMAITLESQTVENTVSPASLPQPILHDKDSTIEPAQLQTETNVETMDSSNKSAIEIHVPDTGFLPSSTMNNSSTSSSPKKVLVSRESNNQVPSARTSENLTLAVEPANKSSADNVAVNFNQNIFEKFNLTREIIAPEDIKAENSAAFENNDEKQTLCNTLKNMLKDDSVKDCDDSKVTNEQNNSSVAMPSTSSSKKVSLPTGPQSGPNYKLLKALNINFVNDLDVIVDKTINNNTSKRGSPGGIKVKNLNKMLKKVSNPSSESAISNSQAFSGNPSLNVPENIQQNKNYSVGTFQEQSRLPVRMFAPPLPPLNNPIPNAYIIQTLPPPPPPYGYMINPQMSVGVQPLVNMCNMLSSPIPMMNHIGQQVHFPNAGLVNQVPIQNNVQVPAPTPARAATLDRQAVAPAPVPPAAPPAAPAPPLVLASSIFPNMFDTRSTSYSSPTVFSLQLPPLQNVVLPPPYTILSSYDQQTITKNIQNYKFKLLDKIIETLRQLENMPVDTIRKQLEVLNYRQTLTEETWKIQEKILIIAQCVGTFKKLTTEKQYSNIIEAIMGSIYNYVKDENLLNRIFGIFQKLKGSGIFIPLAEEQQPLTLELGVELKQTAIGMSKTQREILKYQRRIDDEIQKIHQLQSNRVAQPNNQMNQNPVPRSSPTALQQNIVTTTVSSPVIDIVNNSFQSTTNTRSLQSVSTASLPGTTKEQHGDEKQNSSIQNKIHSKAFADKCDISNVCLKCGQPSRLRCKRCLTATYCSVNCQTIHWKAEHSTSCNNVNSAS